MHEGHRNPTAAAGAAGALRCGLRLDLLGMLGVHSTLDRAHELAEFSCLNRRERDRAHQLGAACEDQTQQPAALCFVGECVEGLHRGMEVDVGVAPAPQQ
jgi:hypothetical protein